MAREITFSDAILEATTEQLSLDPSVCLMGQGITGPNGIYGTTKGLEETFGSSRIIEFPNSQSTMAGVAIGCATKGLRPIFVQQRVDFFLLALDQLINNGAKWNYMFGGETPIPIVFRLIMGRGWGQGPQLSQTLQSLFAHIPGLKVVMPSTPYDAKGLLTSSIQDNNPVIFLEHRWLHDTFGSVPEEPYSIPLGKAQVVHEGTDVTIVTTSHMTLEGRKAVTLLQEEGISAELIDVRSVKPLDKETIIKSVRKTGRMIVADPDWKFCGFGSEVVATIAEEAFADLKAPPARISYPDRHTPMSWALSNHYYPTHRDIAMEACKMLRLPSKAQMLLQELLEYRSEGPLDVPDASFKGPF
ncbi:MAG: alpha-ketoacid dehydrogenase subunit beta [Chlamydiia bacterium]|nr:alpha-ketoacid dehydrogenase subunit beta [Chlamydiia bacterium]MCP5505465.1 alpha-ketoacid dehydrogenase subunit beta [Chlamydiales bacterium]